MQQLSFPLFSISSPLLLYNRICICVFHSTLHSVPALRFPSWNTYVHTIPGVWNGKLLFHSTLNIPGQSGFPVVCGIGNGKFDFHSILPVWNSRGMLHFFSLIPYIVLSIWYMHLSPFLLCSSTDLAPQLYSVM